MNKSYLLIVTLIISLPIFSQSCFPEGIVFSMQSEIDSLHYYYPDCTEIEGNVEIRGNDIINIDSLIYFTSIEGDLSIIYNVNLLNIEGLSNLNHLGGSLVITNNNSLTSLTGLEGLNEIYGDCRLYYNNPGITNLSGMNGLKKFMVI